VPSRRGGPGRVVVAYGTSAGYDTAPRLLAAVRRELPELDVTTRVLSAGEIVAGITAGAIDLGIVRCPPAAAGVESWLLRRERQGVLVPDDHALAGAPETTLAALRGETVLLHPREANPGHYDAVLALLRQAGVEPRVELRDVSVDLQHTPVLEGRAVAIVGESTRVSVPPRLTWVPLRAPAVLAVRLLARATGRTPAANAFLAAAQEIADTLGWRAA
jgi:LysR substrate binding domain